MSDFVNEVNSGGNMETGYYIVETYGFGDLLVINYGNRMEIQHELEPYDWYKPWLLGEQTMISMGPIKIGELQ